MNEARAKAVPLRTGSEVDVEEDRGKTLARGGRFAILTCMDARIDPARLAGPWQGEVHVVRNAGGHASEDAIKSLVLSHKLFGTNAWLVVHHSNCGMALFSEHVMGALLSPAAASSPAGRWPPDADAKHFRGPVGRIDRLTLAEQGDSVFQDVQRIRRHPLVPDEIPIFGYIFHADSGRLVEVARASSVGRARDRDAA